MQLFTRSNIVSAQQDLNHSETERSRSQMPSTENASQPEVSDDFDYPTGLRFAFLMISIYIAMFLVALDKLIITTALPAITDEFHTSDDVGWYGTAYLLTNAAFLLVFGKLYTFLNVKYTFLAAVLIFEIGSAVCGAAPNSIAFIVGRAIAGLGAGGVQSGVITIIVYAVPLEKRPIYQGIFGAVYGIASVLGPLVGGAFTTDVTWRWCFYLNLPLGGTVFVFVVFLLKVPVQTSSPTTLMHKLMHLNVEGLLALLPGVVCLCLALQWGGFTYNWSDGRIIALLVIATVLLIAFVLIQIWRPEHATLPPRIFTQRSIAGAFFVSCCMGAHQTLILYYLPIWFQAIRGASAVKSGIDLLPQVIALVISSILTGAATSRTGYYTPFLIFGVCLAAIGAGLLTTLRVTTTVGQWIGYQIVYGWGFGGCIQAPNMAAQTILPRKEVSIGASLMLFGQTLFGSIFVSVGENVIDDSLAQRLSTFTDITADEIEDAGATDILSLIPAQDYDAGLRAYNSSLRIAFRVGLVMACVAIFGALAMEWRSVKKRLPQRDEISEKANNRSVSANEGASRIDETE